MTKFPAAIACLTLLGGCAPEAYRPYDKVAQPVGEAQKECDAKARAAYPSKTYIPEFKILQERQAMIDACMTQKGFVAVR